LEISSTPYIFTFKLWDWERLGLDGKPRPIHINHGKEVIQWNRTEKWVKKNLINRIEKISEGEGWTEEKTGLHELEFIETRRHWFSERVVHQGCDSVQVLNLIEGDEVIVESLKKEFPSITVSYGEVFIIPANVTEYAVTPLHPEKNKIYGTIKAFIRC